MKKTTIVSLALLLTLTACSNVENASQSAESVNYVENQEVQAKGMAQIKGLLMGHLKPALMAQMKQDKSGVKGMEMCSASAKSIENAYNETLPEGSQVRRTALKYRNPENKPDATDVAVMTKLKADKNFKPVVVEMPDHFRVYKALDVKKPCLACHGDQMKLNDEVKKIIAKKYPHDLATDFKEGDFRGVVVSEIKK